MSIDRRLAPLSVLLATVLAGCGTAPSGPPPVATSQPASTGTGTATGTGPGTGTSASAEPNGFSTTDIAWLQLTIAMDERILQVLELVPDRSDDPEINALAGQLAVAHRDALSRLRTLYDRSGGPRANPHEGHDMPGMATAAQLDALRRATGRAALDIFAPAIRAHLDQSIRLAQAERRHGTEPATRTAAAETERLRAAERDRLDQLLPTRTSTAPT